MDAHWPARCWSRCTQYSDCLGGGVYRPGGCRGLRVALRRALRDPVVPTALRRRRRAPGARVRPRTAQRRKRTCDLNHTRGGGARLPSSLPRLGGSPVSRINRTNPTTTCSPRRGAAAAATPCCGCWARRGRRGSFDACSAGAAHAAPGGDPVRGRRRLNSLQSLPRHVLEARSAAVFLLPSFAAQRHRLTPANPLTSVPAPTAPVLVEHHPGV